MLLRALNRIDPRLNPAPAEPRPDDLAIDDWWKKRDASLPSRAAHEAEMAKHWDQAGCQARGAPHVVRALTRSLAADNRFFGRVSPFEPGSPHPAKLAAAFLAESCAGAHGLSADDRSTLQQLIPSAASPTP